MRDRTKPELGTLLRLDLGVRPEWRVDSPLVSDVRNALEGLLREQPLTGGPVYGAYILVALATRIASARCALALRDFFCNRRWGSAGDIVPKLTMLPGALSLEDDRPSGSAVSHLERFQAFGLWRQVSTSESHANALAFDLKEDGDETLRLDRVQAPAGGQTIVCIRWTYDLPYRPEPFAATVKLGTLDFSSSFRETGRAVDRALQITTAATKVDEHELGEESRSSTARHPRVFISYSWDSPKYRSWVKELAERLRRNGIDARCDAWISPGTSLTAFMNSGVRNADRVLILCTPLLRQKVHATEDDDRVTGSGWEAGLVTAEVFAGLRGSQRKILPVLTGGRWEESAPSFLLGRLYIDLSCEETFEEQFRVLLKEILGRADSPPTVSSAAEDLDAENKPP